MPCWRFQALYKIREPFTILRGGENYFPVNITHQVALISRHFSCFDMESMRIPVRSLHSRHGIHFSARHIQEKCREQGQELYIVFIDFTKAFDSVNRDGLWQVMKKFGCPGKFISPHRYASTGSWSVILLRHVRCHQWSKTGLCASSYTVQCYASCNAEGRFQRRSAGWCLSTRENGRRNI